MNDHSRFHYGADTMSLNKIKALSVNLILKILISSGSLGSSAILAKPSKVQNLKEYQGFLTHCELVKKNPSSDDSLSHTVRHLFKLSEKKSCADAEKFLKSRSFIVLRFAKLENPAKMLLARVIHSF